MNNSENYLDLCPLESSDFASYYEAIHGYPPFQWQIRLAQQACLGVWPDFLKLPTSSGKTAAIDIAIFALAYQSAIENRPDGVMTAARRIFFVVDRRIIVNEAYLQTQKTAQKLWDAVESPSDNKTLLYRVAAWLRTLTGDSLAPPLDCRELRGGIYRDDAWVRSPLQPTVLTSTVDQVGSRMLFRGYGVSDRNLSIHAAMTANDCLIILDEAHCSKPFSQTLTSIARYRSKAWATEPIESPFSLVQMTATPPEDLQGKSLFLLSDDDYESDPLLEQRHGCSKPVELVHEPKAKGKTLPARLAKTLVDKAIELASKHHCKKIAIVVNRVAIARAAYKLLQKKHANSTSLMIGRMRPIDRDDLTKRLQNDFASGSNVTFESPRFVVATQCLEVGADLDFDGMVCQCASLDSLRQRFGRMNRLGAAEHARGAVVAAEGDLQPLEKLNDEKPLDPIYGNALARTWHWLSNIAYEDCIVDFGIKSISEKISSSDSENQCLAAPSVDATVLMPAHIDMLCQTSPRPDLEPEIATYLHGPNRGVPEVRICWRADFEFNAANTEFEKGNLEKNWLAALHICPPSSAECLTVPMHLLKQWLRGGAIVDLTSDVLGEQPEEESAENTVDEKSQFGRMAIVWRGRRHKPIATKANCGSKTQSNDELNFRIDEFSVNRIRANDTIVIPAEFGGWTDLGFIPNAPAEPVSPWETLENKFEAITNEQALAENPISTIDIADRAFEQSRARTILRVHRKLTPRESLRALFIKMLAVESNSEADLGLGYWREIVKELQADDDSLEASLQLKGLLECPGTIERYPGGLVWVTDLQSERLSGMPPLPIEHFGDDSDALCETGKLSLMQHLADVYCEASRFVSKADLPALVKETITTAAKLHDLGKADPRFQSLLIGKSVCHAFMQPKLWAKSDNQVGL